MRQFLTLAILVLPLSIAFAGNGTGFKIQIKITGFQKDTLYLGYHYGDKQYLRDTTVRNSKDLFVFEGVEPLPGGIYLVVLPPDNKFFEILVDADNQSFEVETSFDKLTEDIKVKNSTDNKLFYDYLHFIATLRPEADSLRKKLDQAEAEKKDKSLFEKKLDDLDAKVKAYQNNLLQKNPKMLTAAIIRATQNPELPKFEGTDDEIGLKKWQYTREHYFDNIDLKDDRLVRTSFLFQRLDYYVNKLTVQHPDSINVAMNRIFGLMDPKGENFKYYLVHFLNFYAKSNIVGMDAVYVHIVKNYYATGLATWTDEETLKKIIDNATVLEPLLIGKIAPDINMETKDGKKISLHAIQSPYTILYIWDPDCGHCKKQAPMLVEFYEKWKDRGVKILSVCAKFLEEVPKCWESVDEKEFSDFLNVVDPYHRSRYKTIYDVKTTPQVYILDSKKEILMKRIGAEQMDEVMEQIVKVEQEKAAKEKKQGK